MILSLSILIFFLILLIIIISRFKLHPFLALVIIALALGISMGLGGVKTTEVLLTGFSETLRWIAIIIILGAFIGEVLKETGGAFRISNRIIKWSGKKKLPWAMGCTGYLISIPVFVDVAYILLQPVIESLSVKSKNPVLYIGLSLTAGLTVAHTLIPPTPGPLAVASLLQVDIGRMLFINMIVAIFAMFGGILFVKFFVANTWLEYDKKISSMAVNEDIEKATDSEKGHFMLDLIPILIPILLIGAGSFIKLESDTLASGILGFLTTPLIAVFLGALLAGIQIRSSDKKGTINRLVEQSILKAALVIMITGAGGSLGYVIKETGIQNDIAFVFSQYSFLGVILPFVVASLLTISTGSITVSLVGTASMIGPLSASLPMSPEITAALIGSGAFVVFHANSSFFWLLNRLHEVPPKILYRTFTIQSLVMGFSGLSGVLILMLLGL